MIRLRKTPRSRLLEQKAFRNGWREKIQFLNGDSYIGEWKDDNIHGKGKYFYKNGLLYEGDFVNNKRHGDGAIMGKKGDGTCVRVYVGEWKYDQPHGIGTWYMPYSPLVFTDLDDKFQKKLKDPTDVLKPEFDAMYYYKANVKNCCRKRNTTNKASVSTNMMGVTEQKGIPGGIYKGGFSMGQRSNWGQMYYPDGSLYFGDWYMDDRNGEGIYFNAIGNNYEGDWLNDSKHGIGEYHHSLTGQYQSGLWLNGVAKVTEMIDETRQVQEPTPLPIPKLTLLNPSEVFSNASAELIDREIDSFKRLPCPVCTSYDWEKKNNYKPPKLSKLQKALRESCT